MQERELRGLQGLEVRGDGDAGVFTGYIAVWDTVDSYNSSFIRGAFKKTIEERGDRIKVLYDHGDKNGNKRLIGKLTEIREDNHGVFVEGQLTMAVEEARDAFAHMKAGALDTLSFGFRTILDKWTDGIRHILEVKLFEVSPVTFEANEAAMIKSVRSEDFDETLMHKELVNKGWLLQDSIWTTLDDIWWNSSDADEVRAKVDEVLADFHAAYLSWTNEYLSVFWEGEKRSMPNTCELRIAFASFANGRSLESIAAETEFTVDELRTLEQGKLLPPSAMSKIPQEIREAYQIKRRALVESFCSELRAGGFSQAEGQRFTALLNPPEARSEEDILGESMDQLVAAFGNLGK